MSKTLAQRGADDAYEQACRDQIEHWLAAPPDWGTRLMSGPGKVAASATRQLVPVSLLRSSLAALERAAGRVADHRGVLRLAGVSHASELADWSLQGCDRLAVKVERRAMALGGTSGAVFGVGGVAGMVADVPTLLTLALRTIHRTAYCYGEDWQGEQHRSLVIGVFALASANSFEEKQAAWRALQQDQPLLDAAWRDGVERVAERELAKEAAQTSLQTLASRIGAHIGQRKAAGFAPVIGAVIGSAINAGYLHDIAIVARRVLQDRWLRRKYGG